MGVIPSILTSASKFKIPLNVGIDKTCRFSHHIDKGSASTCCYLSDHPLGMLHIEDNLLLYSGNPSLKGIRAFGTRESSSGGTKHKPSTRRLLKKVKKKLIRAIPKAPSLAVNLSITVVAIHFILQLV
jgi:hypothetical protein